MRLSRNPAQKPDESQKLHVLTNVRNSLIVAGIGARKLAAQENARQKLEEPRATLAFWLWDQPCPRGFHLNKNTTVPLRVKEHASVVNTHAKQSAIEVPARHVLKLHSTIPYAIAVEYCSGLLYLVAQGLLLALETVFDPKTAIIPRLYTAATKSQNRAHHVPFWSRRVVCAARRWCRISPATFETSAATRCAESSSNAAYTLAHEPATCSANVKMWRSHVPKPVGRRSQHVATLAKNLVTASTPA